MVGTDGLKVAPGPLVQEPVEPGALALDLHAQLATRHSRLYPLLRGIMFAVPRPAGRIARGALFPPPAAHPHVLVEPPAWRQVGR